MIKPVDVSSIISASRAFGSAPNYVNVWPNFYSLSQKLGKTSLYKSEGIEGMTFVPAPPNNDDCTCQWKEVTSTYPTVVPKGEVKSTKLEFTHFSANCAIVEHAELAKQNNG